MRQNTGFIQKEDGQMLHIGSDRQIVKVNRVVSCTYRRLKALCRVMDMGVVVEYVYFAIGFEVESGEVADSSVVLGVGYHVGEVLHGGYRGVGVPGTHVEEGPLPQDDPEDPFGLTRTVVKDPDLHFFSLNLDLDWRKNEISGLRCDGHVG